MPNDCGLQEGLKDYDDLFPLSQERVKDWELLSSNQLFQTYQNTEIEGKISVKSSLVGKTALVVVAKKYIF